ncbi:MAG TPA: HAMP domain-containing sensor histidine kinase [Rhizomicrobium sp.]|nr:HAMP domain-containing sensor histidine kinase [Rhizomicrobium sp.]
MRAPRTLRTLAFRIVLIYVVIFAASAAALVAFSYWNTRRALDAETDQTIEAEIVGLDEQYQRSGIAGLSDVIMSRSVRGGFGLYLLTDPLKRPLAGNLDAWPQMRARGGNLVEFNYVRRVGNGSEEHRARGRVFVLADGFQLLVARDVDERYKTQHLFTTTLPWTVAMMLALGLTGGWLLSRNLLRRLDSINRTSREIMGGDLTQRLPLTRAGDEIDDLSENLNRMLDRTERLMKGMRTVTDSIAHDLRTPLNRLRNRLESMVGHRGGNADSRGEIEAAVGETDTLISTFNALLLIAEAEAGVVREAMGPVDLPQVVDGIAELYEPVAEEKGVALEVAPSGSARIEGNRSLISQALANLIDNAIKYTPAGGKVRVAVSDTAAGVALSVSDNGPGIPPSDRARVLERFVRLEASRNSPGTGLGLSLVSAVARMHDARLELADNAPGLKATLVFPRMGLRHAAAT